MKQLDRKVAFWQCVTWIVVFSMILFILRTEGINYVFIAASIWAIIVGMATHHGMYSICTNEHEANSNETYY